jgi:hypothetical protein
MLDPESFAEFEAWRAAKILGAFDLSVAAFNAEMAGLALAYEQGVRDMAKGAIARQSPDEVIAENPYRKPGMRGELGVPYTPHDHRTTFTPAPLDDDDEE